MSDENDKNDEVQFPVSTEPNNRQNPKFNVERMMDSFDKIFEEGIPEYTKHKAEQNDKDRDLEDTKNERAFRISLTILAIFCVMWFTTMFMGKFEMANTILQIILAIGAGAGIVSAIK